LHLYAYIFTGENMNREQIIQMAREAGFVEYELDDGTTNAFDIRYERFATIVASAERERILDMCKEGLWDAEGIRYHLDKQDRG
jgi:hypothetical protein